MRNFGKILNYFSLIILLSSCSGLSEAGKVLRNEKIKTTDEFLVKKRTPLVLPPEYDKIPTPGSIKKKTADQKSINQILKMPKVTNNSKSSSSIEQSIINKIGK